MENQNLRKAREYRKQHKYVEASSYYDLYLAKLRIKVDLDNFTEFKKISNEYLNTLLEKFNLKINRKHLFYKKLDETLQSAQKKKYNLLTEYEENVRKLRLYKINNRISWGKYSEHGFRVKDIIFQDPGYILWSIINLEHFAIESSFFLFEGVQKEEQFLKAIQINTIKQLILEKWGIYEKDEENEKNEQKHEFIKKEDIPESQKNHHVFPSSSLPEKEMKLYEMFDDLIQFKKSKPGSMGTEVSDYHYFFQDKRLVTLFKVERFNSGALIIKEYFDAPSMELKELFKLLPLQKSKIIQKVKYEGSHYTFGGYIAKLFYGNSKCIFKIPLYELINYQMKYTSDSLYYLEDFHITEFSIEPLKNTKEIIIKTEMHKSAGRLLRNEIRIKYKINIQNLEIIEEDAKYQSYSLK